MPFYRFINYTSQYGDYELSIRFLSDNDKRPSVRYKKLNDKFKNLIIKGAYYEKIFTNNYDHLYYI